MRYTMDQTFLTGYKLVDSQHSQLFDAINSLLSACEQGADRTGLKKSLDFLSQYTIKHFFEEEQFLKKYGYSDLANHNRYHEAFKKTVADLSHEFILQGVSDQLVKAVENKIGRWLIEHIKGQDFRWARELKDKSPSLFAGGPPVAAAPAAVAAPPVRQPAPIPRPVAASAVPARAVAVKSVSSIPAPAKPASASVRPSAHQGPSPAQSAPYLAGAPVNPEGGFLSIRYKIFFPILILSIASFGSGLAVAALVSGGQTATHIAAIAVILATAGLIAAAFLVLSRWIARPLDEASEFCENLARGDWTQTVGAKGNDELARMMGMIGRTQEGIRHMVKAIGEKTRALSSVGTDLEAMVANSMRAINLIHDDARDMKTKSANQAAGVVKTNAAMGRIIGSIENLNGHLERQAESISQSSTSIEEMIGNITSITASLSQNEEDLRRLRDASSQGNTALQKVSADIQEVSKESERLLEINKVIQNIASQTNLLAMNAAIEAAHAGDVGRGFAVVADEIRKLAESSSDQAKTVSGVLKNIKDALGGISSATVASLKQFEDIDRGFEAVSSQGQRIRASMEQQDAGNKEILEAMGNSDGIARKVRDNSAEISAGSREAVNEGRNLDALTSEVKTAIDRITGGIGDINAAIARTTEISRENSRDIGELLTEISKFKV